MSYSNNVEYTRRAVPLRYSRHTQRERNSFRLSAVGRVLRCTAAPVGRKANEKRIVEKVEAVPHRDGGRRDGTEALIASQDQIPQTTATGWVSRL